jgi:hypothetical protein
MQDLLYLNDTVTVLTASEVTADGVTTSEVTADGVPASKVTADGVTASQVTTDEAATLSTASTLGLCHYVCMLPAYSCACSSVCSSQTVAFWLP